jgi:hypothetical protein
MIAVELETPIVDHRISVCSDQLPARLTHAKVIVLFDDVGPDLPRTGVLASLRASPVKIRGDGLPLKREEANERPGVR